jgi:hypothetical protein
MVTLSGQLSGKNRQDVLLRIFSQRASRGPFGVDRQTISPSTATTSFARHAQPIPSAA